MDTLKVHTGERIQELRKDSGLNQIQFAKVLKISPNTVSAYERGKSLPSIQVLLRIAQHFNVSLDYLLGLTREEVPYKRENYIALPREKTTEIRAEMLNHLQLVKIKYNVK